MIATHCRRCREPFTPDHRAILAGTSRLCPACRDAERPDAPPAPTVCPTCRRILKSGAHRNGCPGRGRRRGVPG